MTSEKIIPTTAAAVIAFLLLCPSAIFGYEIFICRPHLDKKSLQDVQRITLHGEFFGYLQYPSTYPSFNDLSGPEDRWTYGFHNLIFLTQSTVFHAQLVTHDDGGRRTKFDWHFSIRQQVLENLVLIVGHDSNHDADYESQLDGKRFYLNRNYVGFGLPIRSDSLYIEPFTWFFHHTNQRGHLDLSGNRLRQEYGLRFATCHADQMSVHVQILAQSESMFSIGQSYIADLILRIRITDFLEFSMGASLWKDIQQSRLGNQKNFYKLFWGIAIPF